MSAPAHEPALDALESAARDLRARHVAIQAKARPLPARERLGGLTAWLDRARTLLADPEPASAKAAEWLLDNDYQVLRAQRQVAEDLTDGFYARLPGLTGESERGLPRAFALAHGLLAASHMQLSLDAALRFVRAYQEGGAWLTIAELWAFPALLRLACLELLVTALARVVPELEPPFPPSPAAAGPGSLEDTECIARALSNLGVIASISWKDFFEGTSRVEAMLRRDPAAEYARMDFETRDRYRKRVEALASHSPLGEAEVARRVVERARGFLPGDGRRAHVGEWLLGEGRESFESSLGFRVPAREAAARWLFLRAGPLYAAALAIGTAGALAVPAAHLYASGASPLGWLLGIAFALLPASLVGVTLVHFLVTRIVPPRVLPKLDFEKSIPAEFATAVVVPALVSSPTEARELVERLEGHYLANPDPTLRFALLTDPLEGPAEHMPGDEAIERTLIEEIRRANARQHPAEGAPGPFHVLHRHRRFNPAEGCWMGWERKRGKLEQWNQLLAGAAEEEAGFAFHEGDADALRGVRFVVTVDADTRLPPGSVARLAGALAHPLNRAEFDDTDGTLRSGYSVVQPRIEISPESGRRSLFARLYSGDTAIDIYTCAASDVYQDLFGTGIYVGKGIYDVEAFARSLSGRVPENRLASHDLFEGLQGRAGLATDIVLYETFPSRYEAFARRWHRWVRGDWQLVPWLGRQVPGAEGVSLPNRLSLLGRWQILDNLRRSLLPASLVALLAAGWLLLPGSPWFWTAIAVASPIAYPFADLITGLARERRHGALRGGLRRLGEHAGRWLLDLVFLPQDAGLALDAALRTLWRVYVTRKNLLQWTSAAHVAAHLEGRASRAQAWGRLWVGPASAALLAAALAALRPSALVPAAPLLLLWLASPEVALLTGRRSRFGPEPLDGEARVFLRALARRTWLFFETFAGPEDHWLPPDNYQEHPHAEVAHRTSPTNVGMLLLSSLGAWDLGYVGLSELAARLRSCLDTLNQLDRDRGHLFNWYDTRSLAPLEPRYVSTVDSGNLAVSLVALKEGCRELAAGPALRRETWDGLADVLRLLKGALEGLAPGAASGALRTRVERLEAEAITARDEPAGWRAAWLRLGEEALPELDRLLVHAVEDAPPPVSALREIRTWLERAHHHVRGALRESEQIEPWQALLEQPPRGCEELARDLARVLAPGLRLAEATERCARARSLLSGSADEGAEAQAWRSALRDAVARGDAAARGLREHLREIATRAEALAFGMDFRMLYDSETRRFRIGYNASADRLDGHHYDLLATEARLASFFAIAKGDAPVAHWFHLGRPVTRTASGLALLSWGGSLFEYLMPPLLLRSHPGTLLYESERTAVDTQRAFAREFGMPWGVSESGYAAVDPHGHYRYHAFGVPALGLRRGLARDLVVAPYASALALPVRTHLAVANLRELERLGLCGAYGLLEAADFTPDRAPQGSGQRFAPVRSWMAHHQGMTLAALANTLCGESLVRRFHADRRVRAVELLLHERVPRQLAPETGRAHERPEPAPRRAAVPAPGPWGPAGPETTPRVHALGNGRLACWITEAGSGSLRWHGRALTRWRPDATRDDRGLWIYVRDDESGAIWSAGRQPTGARADEAHVVFHPHLAEFHRRDRGIALRLEVAVAPADDLEIRRLGVANESDRPRTLSFTSYAEVVLAAPLDDERHPAFSKLFVGGEWLPELRGLLLGRRPRHPGENPPVLLHRVISDAALPEPGFEVDRRAFLGRHGDARRPRGVVEGLSGSSGFTLDPILALQIQVTLEPGERRELCFVTLAAASRESALELAERYSTSAALDWAIADAAGEAARDVQKLGLEPSRLPELQAVASLLLHPFSALRGPAASLARNRLGQPRLWGLGLSGDLPILLLRAGDPSDGTLLPALVRGHELWQRRGLEVDLVVLRTGASGYVEPLREQLFALLREVGAHGPLGRRGGVHLLFADQIQAEELRLLEAVAGVVLDDARGPLAQQLAAAGARHAELPAFEPVGPPGPPVPSPPLPRAADLLFDNGFGGFAPDGREYVIHLGPGESTPAAWCNVLANEGFGCLTSEAGLGFSWAENSGENRLTPWSNDPLLDPPGEVLYLRDEETAEIWTPTPRPAGDGAACEVRHGAGTTTWRKVSHGFEQELVVFVPTDAPVKIARLRLRNLARRSRRVTATYYAEWQLGSLRSAACPHVVSTWQPAGPALLARSAWNPDFAGRVAFLTATRPPHGLAADRREFLGREGDLRRPAALLRWGLSDRVEPGADPCAAYQVHLDLGPEELVEVAFVLGQGRDAEQAEALVQHWRDPASIEAALEELVRHWDHLLGAVQVRTPEPSFDLMLNRWLLYQTVASRLLARAGFHQAGGAIGFRDQLQDVLALLYADPGRVRAHLLACAAHQFEEGDVLHWWHPPADRGVRTHCSDDLLWLPWVASAYVEATGDASVLDEQAPFLRAPPLGPHEESRYSRFDSSGERRSLLEHCERALERGVTRGAHGLPLIGSGDWNDGMDRIGVRGRGESVWLAWFAISAMKRFAGLCERRERGNLAERWRRRAEELALAVEEAGWDGEWYLRAFDDDGRPYGSHTGDEARIDSIAQSWSVLSGAGNPERARRALAAAERQLVREDDGVVRLLWPPLDATPRDPGYIKAYPPGVRENGGQYSHAAAWLAFAFAERGDGARTARLFALLNPVARTAKRADAERHRGEPYVLAADIGSVAPHLGRAGWTWYTGSAAWTWRLGVEAMLGLRLREGRVAVAPCLPPGWQGYEATLRGPAGALSVQVEVTPDLAPGCRQVRCEGALVGEEGVAFPGDGSTRRVDVRIGGAPEGSG